MRSMYKTCHYRPAVTVPTDRHCAHHFSFRGFRARVEGHDRQFMRLKVAGKRRRLPVHWNRRQVPSKPGAVCNQFTNKPL